MEYNTPITLCYGAGIILCELYTREREIQLAERERALLELERRWRGGEQWPQTSKTAWLFLNCMYTHSHDCIDYSKRGHKSRRRRRKRPERPGGISNSVATNAGSSTPSFHASTSGNAPTPQLSPPTSTSASEPSSVNRYADTHPANLIDFNSPPLTPGENISGMMNTMNITE